MNINSVLAAFTTYANYPQPDSSKTSFLSNVPTTALSFFTPQEAQGKRLLQTTGPQPFSLLSVAELGSWKSRTLATFHHAFPIGNTQTSTTLGQYSSDRFLRYKFQQAFPRGRDTEPGWQ